MKDKDKRQYIRLRVHHLVKYREVLNEKTVTPFVMATIKDIGAGGICLRTDQYIPVSSMIELRINFPNVSTFLYALAKIVWVKQRNKSRRYEVGANFMEIKESMRKIIEDRIKLVYRRAEGDMAVLKKIFLKKRGGRNE